jgi:hypothetical protein
MGVPARLGTARRGPNFPLSPMMILNVGGLQQPPDFNLSLISIFRKSFDIFLGQRASGRSFAGEFFADVGGFS